MPRVLLDDQELSGRGPVVATAPARLSRAERPNEVGRQTCRDHDLQRVRWCMGARREYAACYDCGGVFNIDALTSGDWSDDAIRHLHLSDYTDASLRRYAVPA